MNNMVYTRTLTNVRVAGRNPFRRMVAPRQERECFGRFLCRGDIVFGEETGIIVAPELKDEIIAAAMKIHDQEAEYAKQFGH